MAKDDQVQELNDFYHDLALSKRRPEGPTPTGACLNCGELLDKMGSRWCDSDCRDDWEKRNRVG